MGLSGARAPQPRLSDGAAEPMLAQAAGEKMVVLLSAALEQSLTLTGDLNKWILASLVTLNGGAIVVLGNVAGQMAGAALSSAIVWFAAGCVLAVLTALVGALSAIATSEPLGAVLGFWMRVRSTGEFDEAENAKLIRRLTKRGLLTYGASVLLGVASLACFSVGIWTIADQIAETTASSTPLATS